MDRLLPLDMLPQIFSINSTPTTFSIRFEHKCECFHYTFDPTLIFFLFFLFCFFFLYVCAYENVGRDATYAFSLGFLPNDTILFYLSMSTHVHKKQKQLKKKPHYRKCPQYKHSKPSWGIDGSLWGGFHCFHHCCSMLQVSCGAQKLLSLPNKVSLRLPKPL